MGSHDHDKIILQIQAQKNKELTGTIPLFTNKTKYIKPCSITHKEIEIREKISKAVFILFCPCVCVILLMSFNKGLFGIFLRLAPCMLQWEDQLTESH